MTKREKLFAYLEEARIELDAIKMYIYNQEDDIQECSDEDLENCKDFCIELSEKIHNLRTEFMDDDDVCMEIAREDAKIGEEHKG